MSSFSQRHGCRPYPQRDRVEEAPERVRALLREFMLDKYGALGAYHRVCELVGRVPDPNVWSDQGALGDFGRVMDELEWFEVLDLLEDASDGSDDARVNKEFARSGLAYEMTDGRIDLWDPDADALGITGVEFAAESVLVGEFEPMRTQYRRALDSLHGRPADLEKAISESAGALEAVAHIISGEKDFSKAVEKCLSGRPHSGALAASLKQLYGWAGQLPGARHGRHEEPDVTFDDAFLAVRLAGSAIGFLINASRTK